MKVSGNTILITGGATGIGYALAEHFLREGNDVIICGRRSNKLEEAKRNLPKLHIKIADLSKESERKDIIAWIIKNFPSFNVLVNNAGIQQLVSLKNEGSIDTTRSEIDINLIAPIHLTNLVIAHFSKQKEAAIINISSGLGFIPLAIFPVYCATKAALHSYSLSSRHQLKDTSIKVFEIIPPIVETELGKESSRKEREVKGIPASEVAIETLKAIKTDTFEYPIGTAANLCNATQSDEANLVFLRMNG
jgi:uncharacterized oxidoreductase